MPIIDTVDGDLIKLSVDNNFDIIVHGCNCFHAMGAGIAKQIRLFYPEAFAADCRTEYGDKNKLGRYSKVQVNKKLLIVNAYTQYECDSSKQQTDYDAIREVFVRLDKEYPYAIVGIPKIGSGLGGGDWKTIRDIIDKAATKLNIFVVNYVK